MDLDKIAAKYGVRDTDSVKAKLAITRKQEIRDSESPEHFLRNVNFGDMEMESAEPDVVITPATGPPTPPPHSPTDEEKLPARTPERPTVDEEKLPARTPERSPVEEKKVEDPGRVGAPERSPAEDAEDPNRVGTPERQPAEDAEDPGRVGTPERQPAEDAEDPNRVGTPERRPAGDKKLQDGTKDDFFEHEDDAPSPNNGSAKTPVNINEKPKTIHELEEKKQTTTPEQQNVNDGPSRDSNNQSSVNSTKYNEAESILVYPTHDEDRKIDWNNISFDEIKLPTTLKKIENIKEIKLILIKEVSFGNEHRNGKIRQFVELIVDVKFVYVYFL